MSYYEALLQRATKAVHDVDCDPMCQEELTPEGRYGRYAKAALKAVGVTEKTLDGAEIGDS